ncbi:37656_t:CDS:1, partial [Gigaspora margarita]
TIKNKINNYLQTPLQSIQYISFTPILHSVISNEASSSESVPFISSFSTIESKKLHYNATAQKNSIDKQRCAKDQLGELNELYNIVRDSKQWHDFLAQINETKQEIEAEKKNKN